MWGRLCSTPLPDAMPCVPGTLKRERGGGAHYVLFSVCSVRAVLIWFRSQAVAVPQWETVPAQLMNCLSVDGQAKHSQNLLFPNPHRELLAETCVNL